MNTFTTNIQLVYVLAAACFVVGLHLMNSPATARRGNQVSTAGMAIAVIITLVLLIHDGSVTGVGWTVLIVGALLGSAAGLYSARTVQMTAMPQLVSMFNAVGGGAAALVAVYEYIHDESAPGGVLGTTSVFTVLDVIIGSVTFTGSLIAAGKLQGIITGQPIVFQGGQALNIALAVIAARHRRVHVHHGVAARAAHPGARLAGVRGHDGAADRRRGHAGRDLAAQRVHRHRGGHGRLRRRQLGPDRRRGPGRRVRRDPHQADGRRDEPLPRQHHRRRVRHRGHAVVAAVAGDAQVRSIAADDAAIQLAYASKVIIVPGYGLAAAQAQHGVAELASVLESRGIEVSYAIHPVAGRMPGHMNVLLAEANVPYPLLKEMDEINPEFARADVALVIGANDVTNPAARRAGTAISGMPILDVDQAKSIIVIKRSMGTGYAGIDNELYVNPKTSMYFADAKKALAEMTAAVKTLVG